MFLIPAVLGAVVAIVQVVVPLVTAKPVTADHVTGAGAALGVGVAGSAVARRRRD